MTFGEDDIEESSYSDLRFGDCPIMRISNRKTEKEDPEVNGAIHITLMSGSSTEFQVAFAAII